LCALAAAADTGDGGRTLAAAAAVDAGDGLRILFGSVHRY
jgi:hypothetical protein